MGDKVIFLDVDGVLNSMQYFERLQKEEPGKLHVDILDPVLLDRLKEIVDATDARIVLSSSWRIGKEHDWSPFNTLQKELIKRECPVWDVTPQLVGEDFHRGDEIRAWLHDNPWVTGFVILDDDSDMCEFTETEHFIQTSYYGDNAGLQPEHVQRAIKVLKNST